MNGHQEVFQPATHNEVAKPLDDLSNFTAICSSQIWVERFYQNSIIYFHKAEISIHQLC